MLQRCTWKICSNWWFALLFSAIEMTSFKRKTCSSKERKNNQLTILRMFCTKLIIWSIYLYWCLFTRRNFMITWALTINIFSIRDNSERLMSRHSEFMLFSTDHNVKSSELIILFLMHRWQKHRFFQLISFMSKSISLQILQISCLKFSRAL